MKTKIMLLLVGAFLILSCRTQKNLARNSFLTHNINSSQQEQLDALLSRGLDYEALYTLLGKIKPMSTIRSYSFPIANTDSIKKTKADVLDLDKNQIHLDEITNLQHLIGTVDYPDLEFVLYPFQKNRKNRRNLQLVVFRESLLDSLLETKASFFGQFGLVPGTNASIVLSTVENSDRYERLRAYGYLFGYPDYAVDFFVEAMVEMKENDVLLPRNYFQIPSFSAKEGAFVYAYPKKHIPTKVDSSLYERSITLLNHYRDIRQNYLNPDSTLKASELLNDYYQSKLIFQ